MLVAALVAALTTTSCALGMSGAQRDAAPPPATPAAPSPTASPTAATTSTRPTATPAPSPTAPESEPPPPTPSPYVLAEGDVFPGAKRVAADVAATLATYGPGERPEDIAARVVSGRVRRREVTAAAMPLFVPGRTSVGTVVYPQLGGVTDRRMSVMVVTRQELTGSGASETVTRTLDVRLRRSDGRWVFDALASAGGAPPDEPVRLSQPAQAVLVDERITLTDSARWDIEGGLLDDQVLQTMLAMAERFPYAVAVVLSGHPIEVFGTDRTSNHTVGRAVDVYAVDGRLVVHQRDQGSAAHLLSRDLFDAGVTELGSPWSFDHVGGRSFTDAVHQDHLHVGYESRRRDG